MVISLEKTAWQIADAKAHLSEVITNAERTPQTIERRGTPVAVIVGIEAFRQAQDDRQSASVVTRMSRLLETSAALRKAGGVTLDTGNRVPRPSPFARR